MHRPYPQSIESERALLGGLLLDSRRIGEIAELVSPEDFYQAAHGRLFELVVMLDAKGETVDTVSILDWITREKRGEEFGGISYVAGLSEHTPATANLAHYARTIRQKASLRDLILKSEQLAEKAFADPLDVSELLDEAAKEMAALGQAHDRGAWHQLSVALDDEIETIDDLGKRGNDVVGVTTGFSDLDAKLAGLHAGNLVILAARPAMGKTALALNIAEHAALLGGVGVGIFSLEMSRHELARRLMCANGRVDAGNVRLGKLSEDEWQRLVEASEELRRAHVLIDDTGGLKLSDVRARSRRLKAEYPDLGLIVVDYLQLMQGDDPRESRTNQISSISRGLKALAKDLEIPVLALSQLNRGVEARQDKRPMMSDLRESGAIEQDADVILFIYRDEVYNPDTEDKGVGEVIIAKQRAGSTGTVRLAFQGRFTRFDTLAEGDLLT